MTVGIVVVDLDRLWFTVISVPFELEQVEFGILISDVPLTEKSQKECGLKLNCSWNKS